MSYLGNWCIKPETPCSPCSKQWLGRGPMQDVTTQKHDYTWKSAERSEPYKLKGNLYCPCATMSGKVAIIYTNIAKLHLIIVHRKKVSCGTFKIPDYPTCGTLIPRMRYHKY